MKSIIIRNPGARLNEGIVTHIERQEINTELAFEQWLDYIDVFENNGWALSTVMSEEMYPDQVFIEDTAVVYGRFALITNPGADSRKPETIAVSKKLKQLRYVIGTITASPMASPSVSEATPTDSPGVSEATPTAQPTLDGGDVLKVGNTMYVGIGGRTNLEGFNQLKEFFEKNTDAIAVPIPVTKVLHLKSAVTALPDGTIIGYDPFVDDISIFPKYMSVPEESGAHVVVFDSNTILMSTSAPLTKKMFEELGLVVLTVDISEFEKLEGCVTCLSIRLRQ